MDEGTPPIPIPPAEEGWRQMAARLDVVMPVTGAIDAAAAVKGAVVKSGGITLGKLVIGIAAVTTLCVTGIIYITLLLHPATNNTKPIAPNANQDIVEKRQALADVTVDNPDKLQPDSHAVAENPPQKPLADEKTAVSHSEDYVVPGVKTAAKTPENHQNQNTATPSPPIQVRSGQSLAIIPATNRLSERNRHTKANGKKDASPQESVNEAENDQQASVRKTQDTLWQKEPKANLPQGNDLPSVARQDNGQLLSTTGVTDMPAKNPITSNVASASQGALAPATAANIRDLLTPVATNRPYEHKLLQAPEEVINRLFSSRPPRKGSGMAWELLLQWNLPLPAGDNWLKGAAGKTQAYTVLIPGLRLQYGRPEAAVSLDLNVVATQAYNSAGYKLTSSSLPDSGVLRKNESFILLKSYGYSATLAYQHRIYNKWYGAAGIQAFYAREGAIDYTQRYDSSNLLIKNSRYGDKTAIWEHVGRWHWGISAEGFYNHDRWQVGGRVQIPVLMKTDSLTSNIKARMQAEILLRFKIYKKK